MIVVAAASVAGQLATYPNQPWYAGLAKTFSSTAFIGRRRALAKDVEKAIAEITANNRGERLRETPAMIRPPRRSGRNIVDHPVKYTRSLHANCM